MTLRAKMIKEKLKTYIDNHIGSDTKVEHEFKPMLDAVAWRVITTIDGIKYRFDYNCPLWEVVDHKERTQIDHATFDFDFDFMYDELELVFKRAFGWRHCYVPPEAGGVIDINGNRI